MTERILRRNFEFNYYPNGSDDRERSSYRPLRLLEELGAKETTCHIDSYQFPIDDTLLPEKFEYREFTFDGDSRAHVTRETNPDGDYDKKESERPVITTRIRLVGEDAGLIGAISRRLSELPTVD